MRKVNFRTSILGTMEKQLEQIKNRQLARLMNELRAVQTPQIILDAVGKYFNFLYLDMEALIKKTGTTDNDKFNK